jgi:phosphate transport system substrate-binding protein
VRAVPLTKKPGGEYIEATPENAASGKFPLSRYLYVYVNKAPNKPLPPLEREFVKLILSKTGQGVVIKDGYVPISAKIASKEMEKL